MNAARARRLGPADQPVLGQDLAHDQGDLADMVPGHARHGVQVDPQLVGVVEVVGPNRVGVQVQAAQVGQPGQARRVVDDDLVGGSAGREGQLDGADPVGSRLGRPLLEEELAVGPVDVTLEGHRPPARAAQGALGHGQVVGHQIALGVARAGEEDLVRIADRDPPAGDLDDLALGRHGRTIAPARKQPGSWPCGEGDGPPLGTSGHLVARRRPDLSLVTGSGTGNRVSPR